LAASWIRIWRITARARRVAEGVHETTEISVPMTWGLWRYDILLPATSADWPAGCRSAVLLHEAAHADRKDGITQLAAQLACCLHWFNPFAWLAERRMASERERACDDIVVVHGFKPSDYAEQLVSVARTLRGSLYAPAEIAMAGKSQLEHLDRVRPATSDSNRNVPSSAAFAAACCCPLRSRTT
jgi:beta-lactamase regulating signal transducer with metallopeptidase domain